ncbi:hypothetical protein [Sphaerotilus sp.]|uniref:hypothetical protein n=1 Tax=Sphaerotilus sp. TaxID=2093942 RepID=UPI002ACEEA94|nr:hypothetical protein [Sphaerotilus sp.]MDZ7858071.1 hypothetical protein [Sphaerotilus sp.]
MCNKADATRYSLRQQEVFDVAAQTCKQSLWLGGRQAEKQLPTDSVAGVLNFFRDEVDSNLEGVPPILTLLADHGAKLGNPLSLV